MVDILVVGILGITLEDTTLEGTMVDILKVTISHDEPRLQHARRLRPPLRVSPPHECFLLILP
jgi:hypothetical protein